MNREGKQQIVNLLSDKLKGREEIEERTRRISTDIMKFELEKVRREEAFQNIKREIERITKFEKTPEDYVMLKDGEIVRDYILDL